MEGLSKAINGSACTNFQLAKGPLIGNCQIDRQIGFVFIDQFCVQCANSSDDITYVHYYVKQQGRSDTYNYAFSNSLVDPFCSYLPEGSSQTNYSQQLCVRAFNGLNAFSDLCFATVQVFPYAYSENATVQEIDVDSYITSLENIVALGTTSFSLYFFIQLPFLRTYDNLYMYSKYS